MVNLAGYADRLNALEFPIPPSLETDMILASLPPSYDNFYHELQHEWDGEGSKRVVRYAENC